jgi:membrane protease YdiL (CAAX protease family)
VGLGIAAGALGTALWIALIAPLAGSASEPWPPGAVALRLLAAVALVPLAEELLMRGYVLGLTLQWQRARAAGVERPLEVALRERSLAELEPGAWSALAVALSTLLFAAGHQPYEWPAALAYGLLMACLWIVRRDLLSCVVAHATTNLSLAATVLATGRWELW